VSFNGPLSAARDTSNDQEGQFSLTCFANAQLGRDLGKLSMVDQKKAVMDDLKRVFGRYREVPEPLAIVQKQWSTD
jgi:monoamine oxidase